MTGRQLKQYRKKSRRTQEEVARELGVSQTYLSLLESGKRSLTEELEVTAVKKFNLPLTELPAKTKVYTVVNTTDDQLTADLAALGYGGFLHWKPSQKKNPADVLLSALNASKRDARLVEALPWVVLEFPDMEWNGLIMTAKAHDLQNRLGFVTNVAMHIAEKRKDRKTAEKLKHWESELERSKLVREETLCNETMTNAERNWLQTERPEAARQWHLLTGLAPHHLRYYDE